MNGHWLVLTATLPTQPSGLRVRVWRALRSTGAGTLREGVYILPEHAPSAQALRELAQTITDAGAEAHLLVVPSRDAAQERSFRALFDRSESYAEFLQSVKQARGQIRMATEAGLHKTLRALQAQLQVLQAQVEPHFLFNTLAAVDYLIETDPARASQMQKKLITYLRSALPQMRQESSTLGRELRLIRSYLDLIKMRIEERLEVEVEVADFLESAEFPPMMLQSLVENAIKHGIEPKPEGGKVSVSAKIQRGMLWVEVRDTGVGVVDTERLEAPTSGGGIGLQNIRERLAVLYPGKGRLTLMSDDSTGTVVRIGVPYRDADETEEAAEPQGQGA